MGRALFSGSAFEAFEKHVLAFEFPEALELLNSAARTGQGSA